MYHVIFVCKYRKPLLITYGDFVKESFIAISFNSDFKILKMEVATNHIHMLIKSIPTIAISQIARKLKQESTIKLWNIFSDDLRLFFWKEHTFWSDGYFCCSIGNASSDTIEKYIQEQG